MKKLFLVLLLTGQVFASSKNCTSEPKSKWMKIEDFKAMVTKKGFKIRKFKQPGSCYEIYGTDPDGIKVEIYFNPTNGKVVKYEIED